jgi:CRP/FNR family cyclic AMP-dependent transcriptional regulator
MCPEVEMLKEIPLFQLLGEEERKELASQLELVRYPAGHMVFHIGDPGDSMFIVCKGELEVFFKNDTGERIVLERPSAGDFFGELAFLEGGSRSASVETVTDTELFRLSHANLERFVQSRPQAALHILAAMGRRLRATAERLRHTATRNVNEEVEDQRTFVQKAADGIAAFSGSIPFLIIHVIWFSSWLIINTWPGLPHFDPYPFGFLTLTVSLEAIFLSVFVLLAQNRQAAKERIRADVEYDVNLKAELEIAHLHEKVDRLNSESLRRLETIQELLTGAGKPAAP